VNETPSRHIPALDGLRAVAVVAVLFFHAGHLRGGFLGVDLFFVLSGFLITGLLLREQTTSGTVTLRRFWGRRARRLMPAVAVLLVGVTLLATWLAPVPERAAAIHDGPWAQAYLANWHLASGGGGYWASFQLPRLFGHLWSLAIEEQFYLVWPVVVLLLGRYVRRLDRGLIIVCTVGAIASLTTMILLLHPANPTRVYMGTDTRASSLLLGALAATAPFQRMFRWLVHRLGRATDLVVIATWVALGFAWATIDGPSSAWLFRGGLFAVSATAMLSIGLLAAGPRLVTTHLLGRSVFCWVGRLSYSLYLWHWPLFVLLDERTTGISGWALLVVRFAASIAAAAASLYLVENPVRFRALWAHGARGTIGFSVATAMLVLFWVLVPRPYTAPADLALADLGTSTTSTTTSTTTPTTPPRTTAAATDTSAVATTAASSTSTTLAPHPVTKVLLLGDSIAFDEAPAVMAAFGAAGIPIATDAFPGAGIAMNTADPVAEFRQNVIREQPDLVLYQLSLWDNTAEAVQSARYLEFTDMVLAHGASLVFITPPPLRADQQNSALDRLANIVARMVATNPGNVVVLDSAALWGPTFAQDMNGDKIPERKPDGVHVCPSGAARFASWLISALSARFTVTPPPVAAWATGTWTKDKRYRTPAGICANLP
jgi:peptidoglycan/LPS O-acetylase OafA/YrhL